MRGKENFFVYLNTSGQVIFCTPSLPQQSLLLTKPSEQALKFLLGEDCVYLITARAGNTHLKFYRITFASIQAGQLVRERILSRTSFHHSELKQVDSKHSKVVVEHAGCVAVWNLEADSCIFSCPGTFNSTVWYSQNHIVQVRATAEGTLFTVTDLENLRNSLFKITQNLDFFQIEVLGNFIVIGSSRQPVYAIQLQPRLQLIIGHAPPRFYMETEQLNDALLAFSNGTACFVSSPNWLFNFETRRPIFTDSKDIFVVFDNGRLKVISPKLQEVWENELALDQVATCVGINEDTQEVYLGCANGMILILE